MIQCYSSQFVPLLRFYYHIVSLCRFEICSYMTSPRIAFFFLSILDSLFCQCEYNMKWTIDCLCILEVPLSRAFSHYCLFTMITVGSHYTLLNIVCLAWTVVFVSCLVQDKNIIMIERYHYFTRVIVSLVVPLNLYLMRGKMKEMLWCFGIILDALKHIHMIFFYLVVILRTHMYHNLSR